MKMLRKVSWVNYFECYHVLYVNCNNYICSSTGIYWTTFESTKRGFEKPTSEKNTFLLNFFCGSVAGSVSTKFFFIK